MTAIRCVLITATGQTIRSLRRYSDQIRDCQGKTYHDARNPLDVVAGWNVVVDASQFSRTDPRWPVVCDACLYAFQPGDQWQVFPEMEYRRADGTGGSMTLRTADLGAMWWADWLAGHDEGLDQRTRRQGQPHLMVKTPGGDWDIDATSSNAEGQGWTREGNPPDVVARPSIQMARYHGHLGGSAGDRPGFLIEC